MDGRRRRSRWTAYGATDDFGFQAVENRVSIHDLHATILNQLGLDHERPTYRYAGRDFRLTDVQGRVVRVSGVIAPPFSFAIIRPHLRYSPSVSGAPR